MFTSSPSSDDPDGNGLLQLPRRSIDDITANLNPLATHPWPVKDIHLKKHGQRQRDGDSLLSGRFKV